MSSDFEVDAPPIESLDELVVWFAAGEKPNERLKVGVEHEKLPVHIDTLGPVEYESGIAPFLEGMQRFGWEQGNNGPIVALRRGEESITLEPGAQIELAGAPHENLRDSLAELERHVREVNEVGAELGLAFAWLGLRPCEVAADMPKVPKLRYRFMTDYLPTRGRRALDMMYLTATVQANFDFRSEADMIAKMRTAMRVSPAICALFCNSPFRHGAWDGYRSSRYAVWREVDPDRCGYLPFVFDPDFGYRRYLEWALDIPMLFYRRGGEFIPLHGKTFRQFFEEGHDGVRPNIGDFETHISLTFPEVRLKQFIEVRSVDCVPPALAMASVALWKGILYDNDARQAADALFAGLGVADLQSVQFKVAQDGLRARVDGRPVSWYLDQLMTIASDGLARLGGAEAALLEPARELLDGGETLADRMIGRHGGGTLSAEALREVWMAAVPTSS